MFWLKTWIGVVCIHGEIPHDANLAKNLPGNSNNHLQASNVHRLKRASYSYTNPFGNVNKLLTFLLQEFCHLNAGACLISCKTCNTPDTILLGHHRCVLVWAPQETIPNRSFSIVMSVYCVESLPPEVSMPTCSCKHQHSPCSHTELLVARLTGLTSWRQLHFAAGDELPSICFECEFETWTIL